MVKPRSYGAKKSPVGYRIFYCFSLWMFLIILPIGVEACPVCAANRVDSPPSNQWVFYISVIIMLLLPVGMVSAFFTWIRRHL
jgi:hypothetical protein